MLRAKLVVFAALALVFAQLHCAVACADQLCGKDSVSSESAPPCHRHHNQSQHGNANSCTREAIAGLEAVTQSFQTEVASLSVPGAAIAVIDVRMVRAADGSDQRLESWSISRPQPERLSSVVLRI